jgi:hypothetical protein
LEGVAAELAELRAGIDDTSAAGADTRRIERGARAGEIDDAHRSDRR